MQRLSNPAKPEMVLIGVSTGGPVALAQLLPAIPRDIGVPILIVQHMPPIFTKSSGRKLGGKVCGARSRSERWRVAPAEHCLHCPWRPADAAGNGAGEPAAD